MTLSRAFSVPIIIASFTIDELWGEPFRAFSIPIEEFYESRYIKIGRVLRDIDRISQAMIYTFSGIPAFADIEAPVLDLASAAKIKTETLRTDGDKTQLNNVNLLGRQNTFFVTNSGVDNRLQNNRQTRTLVSNSYLEGDVDIVSGATVDCQAIGTAIGQAFAK